MSEPDCSKMGVCVYSNNIKRTTFMFTLKNEKNYKLIISRVHNVSYLPFDTIAPLRKSTPLAILRPLSAPAKKRTPLEFVLNLIISVVLCDLL